MSNRAGWPLRRAPAAAHCRVWTVGTVAEMLILTATIASAQLMSTCVPDSPERRGEIGCTIIPGKVLPEGLTAPVLWHIDRFDSPARARAAAGPASVAFDAAGVWWLMTIEPETTDHHGGEHVTQAWARPLLPFAWSPASS